MKGLAIATIAAAGSMIAVAAAGMPVFRWELIAWPAATAIWALAAILGDDW